MCAVSSDTYYPLTKRHERNKFSLWSHTWYHICPGGIQIPICGPLFLCVSQSSAGPLRAPDEQLCSPPSPSSRLHAALSHLMSACHTHLEPSLSRSDHLIPLSPPSCSPFHMLIERCGCGRNINEELKRKGGENCKQLFNVASFFFFLNRHLGTFCSYLTCSRLFQLIVFDPGAFVHHLRPECSLPFFLNQNVLESLMYVCQVFFY